MQVPGAAWTLSQDRDAAASGSPGQREQGLESPGRPRPGSGYRALLPEFSQRVGLLISASEQTSGDRELRGTTGLWPPSVACGPL